jgi:predicted transcriptional regulator of viral defense system
MYLHELTEQIPKTLYLNSEQLPKYSGDNNLSQESIDLAFKRPGRTSKNITSYDGYKICLLNGMYTGKLGVIEKIGPNGEEIFVTDVERTLIDIAVRSIYSGGVFEVLKAYKLARNQVSINKLSALLSKINFKYPYFQAIGFYLDKAGVYKESQIDLIRQTDLKYDFYLTHQMKEMEYSKKWQLYFPKGL